MKFKLNNIGSTTLAIPRSNVKGGPEYNLGSDKVLVEIPNDVILKMASMLSDRMNRIELASESDNLHDFETK